MRFRFRPRRLTARRAFWGGYHLMKAFRLFW